MTLDSVLKELLVSEARGRATDARIQPLVAATDKRLGAASLCGRQGIVGAPTAIAPRAHGPMLVPKDTASIAAGPAAPAR